MQHRLIVFLMAQFVTPSILVLNSSHFKDLTFRKAFLLLAAWFVLFNVLAAKSTKHHYVGGLI